MNDTDTQHLAAIVRDSDDAIISMTLDGRILSWNGGAERIYGYTAAEAIAQPITLLIPTNRDDELPIMLRKLSEGAGIDHYDTLRVTKDGHIVNISLTVSPIRDQAGAIIGASTIGRDVTREKEAEDALRASARAYQMLMEQASDAILLSYPDQRLLEVNQRACEMFGYTREELLELTENDLILPETFGSLAPQLDKIMAGQIVHLDRPMRCKDGTLIVAELSIRRLDDGRIVTIARDITARKQAEIALQSSEERFRRLFEHSPDSMVLIDPYNPELPWRIIDCNASACQLNGYSREELLGMSSRALSDTATAWPLDAVFLDSLRQEGGLHGINAHTRKDGSIVPVEYSVALITIGGRELVLGIDRDITERLQTDEQRRRSEAYFRALTEHATDLVSVVNRDGTIRYTTSALERMLGFHPVEHVGTQFLGLIHADDMDRAHALFTTLLDTPGMTFSSELRMRHRDGSWRVLDTTVTNLLDEPDVLGIIVNSHDITERKHAEEQLLHQLAFTTTMTASLGEGVCTLDQDGRLTFMNPAAEHLLGWSAGELLGEDAHERFHFQRPDGTPLRKDDWPLLAVLQSGQLVHQDDDVVVRKDGTRVPVASTSAPLRTAGQITGAVLTFRDISERMHSEMLLRTSEHTMRQRLQRLTALRAIDLAITGSVDLHSILDVVLEQVISQLSVDAATVLVLNHDTLDLTCSVARGFRGSDILSTQFQLGEGVAGRAALERQTIQLDDLPASRVVHTPLLMDEGFTSYCVIPLVAKGQVAGVLEIFHRGRLEHADTEWHAFLEALGGQTAIAINNATLFDELGRANVELRLAYNATIAGWSHALDLRDHETEGHSQRVTQMTVKLAQALGVNGSELLQMQRGALLHDIGKMGIPDSILLKAGPLTDEEWVSMRLHPVYAHELLAPISFLQPALAIPYCHHEKWDGTGYPRGLAGEQIPLAARIFAVADVYDALRSNRPYRPGWSEERVFAHILTGAGTHFDPAVVAAFERLMARPALLIVDDEPGIVEVLRESLEDLYTVHTATSGAEALALLAKHPVALLLTDQYMPGMTGIELLARAQVLQPDILGLLFSAAPDAATLVLALNLGIVRGFVSKPWKLDDLRAQVEAALATQDRTRAS